MKQFLLVCFLVSVLAGCSSHTGPSTGASEPKLRMQGDPRQGFAPLRVTFYATLEGVSESDPDYYCLEEKWDFDDGAVSYEKPSCDPYEPGKKIKTEFFVDHLYDEFGQFQAFLTLGNKKIRSENIRVFVLKQPSQP